MRRATVLGITVLFLAIAGPAFACGGLVAPNGAVRLVRTTTLAAYHDGVEHYVTSFAFASTSRSFGSIIPLPGVPSDVQKGGRWTLQRLEQEVQPPVAEAFGAAGGGALPAAAPVEVLQRHQIGALDIVILKGGGRDVYDWARDHRFDLSPDAPEVLEFYSERSPIFAAARFDAERAERQGLLEGDGTAIHFSIPTDNPWIPLRILGLAKPDDEVVKADLFVLTDVEPAMLPRAGNPFGFGGRLPLTLSRSEPASDALLADLRSDRGMKWLPASGMWLSYLKLNVPAGQLRWDLAIDATGLGRPSPIDAGLASVPPFPPPDLRPLWVTIALLGALGVMALAEQRRARPAA